MNKYLLEKGVNIMKTKKIVSVLFATGLVLFSSFSYAALWKQYDTTVGAFNGKGYTGAATHSTSKDHTAWLDSFTVGGNYTVDARLQGYNGSSYSTSGAWLQKVNDDKLYKYLHPVGFKFKQGRFQFSNNLTTPVNVQVTGEFILND